MAGRAFQPPSNSVGPLSEKPTLETVKSVISTVLSHDSSSRDRKQASDFIDALTNSVYAWEICDQLLAQRESIEISYLAANMLRQKISKDFNELPLEYYSSLKDSILNHLKTNEDYAVQGQLTVTMADLTLLLQAWQNPIEDLAKQLGLDVSLMSITQSDYSSIYTALHNRLIFASIMHQMCDLNHHQSERPLRIGARRREEYEDYLISKCTQSISWWLGTMKEVQDLTSRLNGHEGGQRQPSEEEAVRRCSSLMEKLIGQIYLCYSAWLRIFDEENVHESIPLIDAAFNQLSNTECSDRIHKYAVEVVTATASFCEDNSGLSYLVGHLVSQVFTLEQPFRHSVSNEDTEKASNFAKVFSSVAVSGCLRYVIHDKDFRIVELLLSCLGHYDFDVVEETYTFWWIFLEFLQTELKHSADHAPFICYINRFIMSVTKLCQFDPDEDTVISRDQDIHRFRAETAEIITSLMSITTIEDFLRDNNVLDNLKLDVSQIPWEKLEGSLYLIYCLGQIMGRSENNIRRQILSHILCQQTREPDFQNLLTSQRISLKIGVGSGEIHPQIIATTLKILGGLETLVSEQPDCLSVTVSYIFTTINEAKYRLQLIKYAAPALCHIMETSARLHFSECTEMLMLISGLCRDLDQYDLQAADDLLKCCSIMGSAVKDVNVKDRFFCEVISLNLESLKKILSSEKREEEEPTKYLDRLSVVFRNANFSRDTAKEMKTLHTYIDVELWPVIVRVLESYVSYKGPTIERACRTIRYLLRCLKPEWMIQRVAETMVNLYRMHPQNSSPLYICSILVDEFANRSAEINQGLFSMLEIFCTLTFSLLDLNASQSESLLTMKSYPETIDDMMRLFIRFMKKCPGEFLNCKALESIIELSISSLRLDHQEANLQVSQFLTSFIALAQMPEYAHIGDAIKSVLGARLTNAVIRACLFDLPMHLIGDDAQILLALYSFDKDLFSTWVEATVTTLPKTNIQGIESVTTDQLEDFKKTITTAGLQKNMVSCLRATARLYI